MPEDPKHIYWRPAIESYLPILDEEEVSQLLADEFQRHSAWIESGRVVSHQSYYKDHVERVSDKKGHVTMQPKAGSANIMSDFQSFMLIDESLREMFGVWIPLGFTYLELLNAYKKKSNAGGVFDIENVAIAVKAVVVALEKRREKVNGLLQRCAGVFSEQDLLNDSANIGLASVFAQIVRQSADEQESADRWFAETCDEIVIYFELLGGKTTYDEIDEIADRYFESWCSPQDENVVIFADLMAAKLLQQLFDERYGS